MAEYRNPQLLKQEPFTWDPVQQVYTGEGSAGPDFLGWLLGQGGYLDWRSRTPQGELEAVDQASWQRSVDAARAIPTRDLAGLSASWAGQSPEDEAWWTSLNPTSPDAASIALSVRDKMDAGTATPQERQLYDSLMGMATDWQTRASKPDPWSPLGDQFFGALGTLALGATGGLAAAPLVAGGAGLASTLGSLGTLAGVAGTGAGVIGQATDQDWLKNLGLGLGIAGGLAGGLGGLSNLWSSGVNSLSDAAKLASSAGKITGSLGRIPGAEPLQDVSRYLGYAGQAGNLGSSLGADDWLGWGGDNTPVAGNVAPGVQNLLSAADVATQRGGGGMEWDYSNDWGASAPYDDWSWDAGATQPSAWDTFTGWGDPYGPGSSGDVGFVGDTGGGGGSGGWLGGVGSVLGSIGGFLGKNAGLLGPAASALGSLGGGAIGSNAANEAARLQAAAAQRGLDLQTSMWLSNLERQAPWLEAGRGALSQLTGLSGQAAPSFNQPGMPGTQPFQYSGPEMPGTGFQYTGAGMPQTGFQYSGPGMPATGFQYSGPGMPMQDFKAPTWDELKARDPGIQARLAEAQKAIETSAAARGMTMSGSTLGALQRQSQTLASNEYAPAYQRALGEYQQEYGQDWQRQQETYQRQRAENEVLYGRGYQQQGDLYGRQLAENQLGYNRQWQQQQSDYERQLAQNQLGYGRGMEQYRQGYGEQAAMNQQDYARNQALYGQQYQQMMDQYNAQLAQQAQQWNRLASLSGTGQTAVNQLGTAGQNNATQMASLLSQLGQAQAGGALGGAQGWISALGNVGNSIQGGLQNASLVSALANLNR